jgi:serine/threonine protein kinase
MGKSQKDIKTIFADALEKKAGEERTEYLDDVCGGDIDLRQKVEALLDAYDEAEDVPDGPIIDPGATLEDAVLSEQPGTIIGRYKLLEQIGEGGMAVVFMAEQTQPFQRKVAIKIIKLGMDTKQVIARFEAERQALALMDHPNIAKVYDAGTTETGRPYFVMELVRGISITEYCDKNNLSTQERLRLFIPVCRAIQHAHQKGIIHRDIKPSNVLVTMHDGTPMPKVIDFGIAKAVNQRLTEKTLFTRFAQMIGTPEYMSPEQAEMSALDVDTRTDIYSLGVLLYELLIGITPFLGEELRSKGYMEIQRIIRETDPAKPSTKLSTLGDLLTDIAKHRKCSPELLRKSIRGDLDWIVMKTLEKDRTRRYETAHGLAEDIERHLNYEPVLAGPPGRVYRFKKFLRKHRSQAIVALSMALLLTCIVILSGFYLELRKHGIEAESLKHRSILSKVRESYAILDFTKALRMVEPILDSEHVGPEARLLRAGILIEGGRPDEAKDRLENMFDEKPEIAGLAHMLLARIYWESDLNHAAKMEKFQEHQQLAESLLPETPETYYLRAITAVTIKESLELLNNALALDPGHYESRRSRAYIYYCSENYDLASEDALSLIVLQPSAPDGYVIRAKALGKLGRYKEAIANYDKAIEYTSLDDVELDDIYDQRRETYMQMGKYREALADARKCVSLVDKKEKYHIHEFTALVSLGLHEEAKVKCSKLYGRFHKYDSSFWRDCAKYVIETLEAGRELNLPRTEEADPVFLAMLEAEKKYRDLKAKGRRVIDDGFHANWSPDGTKLAYSKGVHSVSGIAVYDIISQKTELLIVPGKDPMYSPDGQYIAFVRARQIFPIKELAIDPKWKDVEGEQAELWIMRNNGTESRMLAFGTRPQWSLDSKNLFYRHHLENALYSISVTETDPRPTLVLPHFGCVSRDNKYVVYKQGRGLAIKDMSSQSTIARWSSPEIRIEHYDIVGWAKNGPMFLSPYNLWIYELEENDVQKVLTPFRWGHASWSYNWEELAVAFNLFYDIWIFDAEKLGKGQTLEEYILEDRRFRYRWCKAAIRYDPCSALAYNNIAWLQTTCRVPGVWDPGEAIKGATQAVKLAPEQWSFWNTLGTAYFAAGKFEKAIESLEHSEELRTKPFMHNLTLMIYCFRELGDIEEVKSLFEKLYRITSSNLNYKQAVQLLCEGQAFLLDESSELHEVLKHARQGQFSEAMALLNDLQSATMGQDDKITDIKKAAQSLHWAMLFSAGNSELFGNYEEAIEKYELVTKYVPDLPQAWLGLANIYGVSQDPNFQDDKMAIESYTKACELMSWKNASYIDMLAAAYAKAGDFQSAVKWQKQAINLLSAEQDSVSLLGYEDRLNLYESGKSRYKGIIGWWKFDQTESGNAQDFSGFNNNGSFLGDAHIASDPERGNVLSLDGDGDYVNCGNDPIFDVSRVTVSAWVKTNDAGSSQHIPYVTKSGHCYALKQSPFNSGSIQFHIYDNAFNHWVTARNPVDHSFNGAWHHLAGTYDENAVRLYIDGKLKVHRPYKGIININACEVYIGANCEKKRRFYNGLIDDVRIYNYALSEEQIREVMAGEGPGPDQELLSEEGGEAE